MRQALAIIPGDPVLRLIATDTLNVSTCPLELAPGTLPVALAMQGDGQAAFAITRDPSHNLGLLVLRPSGATWRAGSALPLYQAATNGRLFLCSTPDGDTLFLADADAGAARVRVLRRAGQSYALSAAKITTGARPVDLTVAPDGSTAYVLTAGAPSGVTVIDVATLKARAVTVGWPYALAGLRPAVDGRWLYATDPDLRCLRALDPRTMEILRSFDLDWHNRIVAEPAGLAVFPDGSGIVTVNTYSQDLSLVEQVQLGSRPKRPQSRPGMTRPRER
jgi:DNA-binding beta-propeller fold protein YncE